MNPPLPVWLQRIARRDALSGPAWLLICLPSMMWTVAYLTSAVQATMPTAMLMGAAGWMAIGLVWLLARLTWMRIASPVIRAILVLPTFALGALVRSLVTVSLGGFAVGPNPMPFSLVTMTALSTGSVLLVQTYRDLAIQNGRLAAIRDTLAQSDSRARMESESLRSSARQVIRAAVENALDAEQSGEVAALRLRRVSDDVVRPLSHRLSESDDGDDIHPTSILKPDPRTILRSTLAAQPVQPMATAALAVTMSFAVLFMINGFPLVLPAMAALWGILTLLLLPLRFLPVTRLPVVVASVLLVIGWAVAGWAGASIMRMIPTSVDQVSTGVLLVAIIVVVAGAFLAIMRGVLRQQREVEQGLIAEGRTLVTVGRRRQARIRRDRRHLARVLHGVIQPRIVAVSIRLQAEGQSIDADALVQELDSLLSEEAPPDSAIDLERSLQDIAKVWSGSADLAMTLGEGVKAALTGREATARAIVDIACEAVNNAVLRGGASRVDLGIRLASSELRLTVVNSGGPVPLTMTHETSSGLGSQIFDELADDWNLETADDTTVFTATIAIPDAPPSQQEGLKASTG